jgi:hypothetical protein
LFLRSGPGSAIAAHENKSLINNHRITRTFLELLNNKRL